MRKDLPFDGFDALAARDFRVVERRLDEAHLVELADLIGDDLTSFVAADQRMVLTAVNIGRAGLGHSDRNNCRKRRKRLNAPNTISHRV